MLAELVLTTRLLGLVSGDQPIQVQVDPGVRAVNIVVDGKTIANLRAPFQTILHFGSELAPHELTAVAYNADGAEAGRDTQLVNLARPQAEAAIELDRDSRSGRLRATVRWQHISAEKPLRIKLQLDGKAIAGGAVAILPELESSSLHVLQAEVEFDGGVIASKELVFGGRYSEQMPSELTGVLANESAQCFRAGDRIVHTAAIEKPQAAVYFVRGVDATLARRRLELPAANSRESGMAMHLPFRIEGAKMRYVWPTVRQIRFGERQPGVNLFYRSDVADGEWGTLRMLTMYAGPDASSERFADAVAVAAVQALGGAKRRVVVLVLGGEPDYSSHAADVVQRYLRRIGVPLRVWSLTGVTRTMTFTWGEVKDISSPDRLRRATEELRDELERQRIAWLPLQPIEALRAVSVSCP
jgi:hypothetical protein